MLFRKQSEIKNQKLEISNNYKTLEKSLESFFLERTQCCVYLYNIKFTGIISEVGKDYICFLTNIKSDITMDNSMDNSMVKKEHIYIPFTSINYIRVFKS